MKSYLLAAKENKTFGREPGFGENPDHKPTPPYHFTADCLASSAVAVCSWLIALNQWLLLGVMDSKTAPQLDLTPQPGQTPVHFTADICLEPRHLVEVLCTIYNRISAALRNQAEENAGIPAGINLSVDNGQYEKYSVVQVSPAAETINTARADLFLWKADCAISHKRNLITALRAIASDATAALEIPDSDPLRAKTKKFDHNLGKLLNSEAGIQHFYCRLHTNAADFPGNLNKIADAIERGEIGAQGSLFNWGIVYPTR